MKKILLALTLVALLFSRGSAAVYYWDTDGSSIGNDAGSGTGLGSSTSPANWDAVTTNWWDGVASSALLGWPDGNDAVFTGSAGTVTVPTNTTRSTTGLTFKTDGYTIDGGTTATLGTLNLLGPANLVADPGVTGNINTKLTGTAGYNISGGGKIRFGAASNVNSTTGPVSITGGSTLELSLTGHIGGTAVGAGDITLDNGTLKNVEAASVTFLTTNRNIILGPGGGTLDPQATGLYGGIISGTGNTLTKVGTGELRLSGGATQVNTFQKLVISGGMLSIGQSTTLGDDRNLGAVPGSPLADAVTIDNNATLRFLGAGGTAGDTVVLNPNRGFTIGSAGATFNAFTANGVIPGKITGDGGITKTSAFVLTLSSDNDYMGPTNINGGTLRVNNTTGSGTGSNFVFVNTGGTLAGTGTISGTVEVNGGGRIAAGIGNANATLTLNGTVTTFFDSFIDSLVGASGSDVLNVTTPNTGLSLGFGTKLTINGSAATGNPAGQTFKLIDYNTGYDGDLSNLIINNATGYDVTVSDNPTTTAIEVTVSNTAHDKVWSIDADGDWSIAGTDNWTSPGQPNGPSAQAKFLSAATAARTVTIQDASKSVGTLILDNANKYTIASSSTANRLVFSTYSGNAALNVASGSHEVSARVTFTAPTDVTVPTGAELTLSASGTGLGVINNGGMTKTGPGTLTIMSDWGGAGATNINEGTLKFGISAAGLNTLSQITIGAAGTFDMNLINDTFGSLAGSGPIINGGNVTVSGNNTTPGEWSGNYSGTNASRTFTKNGAGTQIFSGSNDFINANINAGTFLANNSTGSALGTSGLATVAANATLGGTGRIGARVSVSGNGNIAPGSGGIGTLTLDGDLQDVAMLTMAATTSRLSFELNTGFLSDTIALVNGAFEDIVFNSTVINFSDLSGGLLGNGDYTLFTADVADAYKNLTVDGSNVITAGLSIGTGLSAYSGAALKLSGNSIVLNIAAAAGLPGDYNDNDVVDAADYTLWRDNLGANVTLPNDSTPGTVTPEDYDVWKNNFGMTAGSGSLSSAAVPEPTAACVVAMAILGGLLTGVRRQKQAS